jgi:uncharacterized membrane protein YbhN (UPF0104 family)
VSALPRSPWRGLGLRLAVATALLALAFRWALPGGWEGLPALWASWTGAGGTILICFALSAALYGANFAAGAWRFRMLLRGAGLEAGFAALLRAYVVAGFFNIVLPGAILGDVYRLADARRDTGRGSEVLGLIALERLLGLAGLVAVALLAAPVVPLEQGSEATLLREAVVFSCALLTGLTLAPLWPVTNRWLRRAAGLVARVSPRAAQAADRALVAVASLSERPGVVARAFAVSVANHLIAVGAVMALAIPLDTHVAWIWYPLIVPFVTLVALLPFSIGGAGVRESLYVALFGSVGMRPEVALALSLSNFAVSLAWGAAGLALFAAGRRRAELATGANPLGRS